MLPLKLFNCVPLVVAGIWVLSPAPSTRTDPLIRMPGTQPPTENSVSLQDANRCLNCHAGYNSAVEPGHNWKGSMMAQAARDPLFWACLTVAAQDSMWAIGTPNAVDLCERCHFPKGWVEGRSDPPNASAMTAGDFDGVQCDFCHRLYDPFFATTAAGTREGNDWKNYWDETNTSTTPSNAAAQLTKTEDSKDAKYIRLFNGAAFFQNDLPPTNYEECASGQFFLSPLADKRASFADAEARHRMLYSRYHKSKYLCATCHDVSNPVLANLKADKQEPLPTELNSAFSYFHVERTFSEFMLSDYGRQGGAEGIGPYSPSQFDTSLPNNYISKCQDCHMRDGVGAGCDKNGAIVRPTQSAEHPNSGQPIHDLTGGNIWIPTILASVAADSPNHDPVNASLLKQGPAKLTLDLTQGQGVDAKALLDGANRAREQLRLAAAIQDVSYSVSSGALSFRIQNQTGHKLISGFPEGRRMFVNVKAYTQGQLLYEVNPYDTAAATLKGLSYNYQTDPNGVLPKPTSLNTDTEKYVDELVYEMHPSSTVTGEQESFHFVLGTDRYKDNRIPPKGFRISEAPSRLAHPRWHGQDAPGYFTNAEYAGGYDDVSLTIATGADYVKISLYYQTTSREYVEFLRDEINGNEANRTLPAAAYVVQGDSFFTQLKAWGDTLWNLWTHNRNLDGAAPFEMVSADWGTPPPLCNPPTPTLLSATPSSGQVKLTWSDESQDIEVRGYRVYYDQSGKSQLLADVGLATTYTDTGLTNGLRYCYKVTTYYAGCESSFSNVLCAIPNASGQLEVGVKNIVTGKWVESGRGKNATIAFETGTSFNQGDTIVLRALVIDKATGLPLSNATVGLSITGPTSTNLTAGPSDIDGYAEATWSTAAPTKKGVGGTPTGTYAATTTNVTKIGYEWDTVGTAVQFTVN